MNYPIISADSHITEAPNTYTDYIDKQWRDKAPRIVTTESQGDVFVIDGMERPIALGLVAAAGKDPGRPRRRRGSVRRPAPRRLGSTRSAGRAGSDGVAAEIIYPTVGMMLCNHSDFAYKRCLLRRLQPLDRRILRHPPGPSAGLRSIGCDEPTSAPWKISRRSRGWACGG